MEFFYMEKTLHFQAQIGYCLVLKSEILTVHTLGNMSAKQKMNMEY